MTTSPRPNWSLALGLPLLVMLVCTIIVYSPFFAAHSTRLSTAVTLDLTVTAPLLYFFAIRKTAVPRMTVIRVRDGGGKLWPGRTGTCNFRMPVRVVRGRCWVFF